MKDSRNITRLDYGRTHGFWVRFQRVNAAGTQKTVSKMFSDGKYGGLRKALAAARTWRDRTARKVGPPAKSWRATTPGYGYVYRTTVSRRAGVADVWVGWIKLGPGRRAAQTSRSIERWGERGAKRKCLEWIEQHRRKLRKRGQ